MAAFVPSESALAAGGRPAAISRPTAAGFCLRRATSNPHLDQTEAAERKQQEDDKKAGIRRRYKWDFDPFMDLFEADLDGNILAV